MEQYGTLFLATIDDDILLGDVYLDGKDQVFSWAGASKRFNVDKNGSKSISRASRLCVWKAIEHYKKQGKKEFDLGGMWSQKETQRDPSKKGINLYKQGFGGEPVTRYYYTKTYSKLFSLFQQLNTIRNM
jgi:hypothetical protein